MSYNIVSGPELAVISGPEKEGLVGSKVRVSQKRDTSDLGKKFNYLRLNGDLQFEPCPSTTRERDIFYICGPSGSGKSWFTKLFLQNYHRQHPRRTIYMFSKVADDRSLKGVPIKRAKIDDRLISEPFDVADFANSCIVFDDIDTLKSKEERGALNQLKNDVLETGRHHNVTAVITSHLPTKGQETRTALNESHNVVLYPSSGMPMDYLLKAYMGFDHKQVKKFKALPSRWVMLHRHYPQTIITEKELFPLKSLADHETVEDDAELGKEGEKEVTVYKTRRGRKRKVIEEQWPSVTCQCGAKVKKNNYSRHLKTKAHQQYEIEQG